MRILPVAMNKCRKPCFGHVGRYSPLPSVEDNNKKYIPATKADIYELKNFIKQQHTEQNKKISSALSAVIYAGNHGFDKSTSLEALCKISDSLGV